MQLRPYHLSIDYIHSLRSQQQVLLDCFIKFWSFKFSPVRGSILVLVSFFTLSMTCITSTLSACLHPKKLADLMFFWIQGIYFFFQNNPYFSFDHFTFSKNHFCTFFYSITRSSIQSPRSTFKKILPLDKILPENSCLLTRNLF